MAGATFPVRLIYSDPPGYAKGGLVDAALAVKRAGRKGDSEIIHINKAELAELTRQWGRPSINPRTGMPEFFLGKIGKKLKKIGKIALPIASVAANFIPGVGPLVSAGLGAASGLLNGGGIGGALMGAAPGLLGGGFRQLGVPIGLQRSPLAMGAQTEGPQPGIQSAYEAPPQPVSSGDIPDLSVQPSNGVSFANDDLSVGPRPSLDIPDVRQAPRPSWGNQNFMGTGIKNKHAIIGGLIGGGLLASALKKKPKDVEPMDPFGGAYSGDTFFGGWRPGSRAPSSGYGYAEGGSLAVQGPGDGRDDQIDARLSDGEYVMDAETVAMLGNGSNKAGAAALDKMRVNLRRHKGRNLARGSLSVKAKQPEAYMKRGRV